MSGDHPPSCDHLIFFFLITLTECLDRVMLSLANKENSPSMKNKSIYEYLHDMYESREILSDKEYFGCEYVRHLTTQVYYREQIDFYRLEKIGENYRIYHYGKDCGYEDMDAKEAYDRMGQLPLKSLLDEAEQIRLSKLKSFDQDQIERQKRLNQAEYNEILFEINLRFDGKEAEKRISDLKAEYSLL